MATIAWISAATVAGGVISIAIAALFALSAPASWVPALVSFAIGTLLGAVFLEILPHAIGSTGNLQALFATVLAGILGFFVLEKLVLWRHCHIEDCEAHDHHADPSDGGRRDRKSTRLNSSHSQISYAVFCLKKKKKIITRE